MTADLHSVEELLEVIVRAAMKREYDKGGSISNARAFAEAVKRREVENDVAIAGSLRLSYRSALKLLAEDETVIANPQAYQPWREDDQHPAASITEANRWNAIQFAMFGLPREHPLRVANREVCTYTRPWNAGNRKATPEEEIEAEVIATNTLAYLEAIAADHAVHLEHDHHKRRSLIPSKPRPVRGELEPIMPARD